MPEQGLNMNASRAAVVVGGGVGGLAVATYLARAGWQVTLFEKSRSLGGRAVTHAKGGFRFNVGPHALYRRGPAAKILAELGVAFRGGVPNASGGYAIDRGCKHALPGGFVSLLTTGLLPLPAKLETARLLASLQRIAAGAIDGVSVRDWLDRTIRHEAVRRLLQALFRLSTYANDPERQSAGSAVAQLQLALAGGVLYLDGGWQTLVDGLRGAAEGAGVKIITGSRLTSVAHDTAVRGVQSADGGMQNATAVIVAADPAEASALVPASASLRAWADTAIPVQAACLDVALARLPRPRALFALGIDRPWYYSVHSAVAQLAPAGGATIQLARYLNPQEPGEARAHEMELEGLLDLVQPGWRAVVVERRFLPRMTVYNGLVTAAAGGAAGRPGPVVPGIDGLYVVGDWVGPDGVLVDAALASAKRAAELVDQWAPMRSRAAA